MKVAVCPTSSVPDGARLLVSDRSEPPVTLVVTLAVLLPAIGSGGVPPATLPTTVTLDAPAAEIWPWKARGTLPPTAIGPAMVQL